MYNKTKYLTSKTAGILSIIMGGIALFLTLLTFTTDCGTCVTTFTVPYLFQIIIRVCVSAVLISSGIRCCTEPVKDLTATSTRYDSQFYWTYTPEKTSLIVLVLSAIYALVGILSIFGLIPGVAMGSLGGFSLIAEIVSIIAFGAIVALQAISISVKDLRVFDEEGNEIQEQFIDLEID